MKHLILFEEYEIPEGSTQYGFYRKNIITKRVAAKPFYINHKFSEKEAWKDYEDYEQRAKKLKENEIAIIKKMKS